MPAKTCQYGSCLEQVGEAGIVVTLKTPTYEGEKVAVFCCAAHASASLARLALDRSNTPVATPTWWRST